MKKMSIFAMLLAAVLVTSYSVSGTYAKYTSSATGTDSARVAKWSFTVGGTETATTDTFTFNLFETAYTNVESENGTDKIIAPGTEGSFNIVLANASEVNAIYDVVYDVTNNGNIPVEFSIGAVNEDTEWFNDISELNVEDAPINMNGGTETIAINWRWSFVGANSTNFTSTQTDITDTALGNAGTAELIVKATVTATQVD